jgi:SAM-dependent methyltransferase
VQFEISLEQLRAAGEETRLRILYLLSQGDLTVTELTQCLSQMQPRVSRHLRILVDAGLIEPHQEGAWRFYRLGSRTGPWLRDFVGALSGDAIADADQGLRAVRRERASRAAAYFAENAARWDALRQLHTDDRLIEAAMLELAPSESGRFLDLGTGTGRMLVVFADRYDEGIGYDLSPEMLAVARVRLEEAGVRNAHVQRRDILHTQTGEQSDSGQSDIVCLHHVLHFLDEPERAICAAAEGLAPGGVLLVADFAAHEREELLDQYAHRRLGFRTEEISGFGLQAGLQLREEVSLAPKNADGLTARVWRLEKPDEPSDCPGGFQ